MEIRNDHRATYFVNLNATREGKHAADLSVEAAVSDLGTLPEEIHTAVRNNGGGHHNHSFFGRSSLPEDPSTRKTP